MIRKDNTLKSPTLLIFLALLLFFAGKCDNEPEPVVLPTAPTLLTPLNNAIDQSLTPELTWQTGAAEAGIKEYNVFLDQNTDPSTLLSTQTTPSFTVTTNLLYNTTYYWRVEIVDNMDRTATSSVFSFTTLAAPITVSNAYQLSDTVFGSHLTALGYATLEIDNNYYIDSISVATVDTLNINRSGDDPFAFNIDGLRFFKGLKSLSLRSHEISDINLSELTLLEEIDLSNNEISNLDLSNNTALKKLIYDFSNNSDDDDALTSIDLSINTALIVIDLQDHEIENLSDIIFPTDPSELRTLKLNGNPGAPFEIPTEIYNNLILTGDDASNGVSRPRVSTSDPNPEDNIAIADTVFGKKLFNLGYAKFGETQDGTEDYYLEADSSYVRDVNYLNIEGTSGTPSLITKISEIIYFVGLDSLEIDYLDDLDTLDASTLSELLYIKGTFNSGTNNLVSLTLPTITSNLDYLWLFRSGLDGTIDLSSYTNLSYIRLSGAPTITGLDITGLLNLETVRADDCGITSNGFIYTNTDNAYPSMTRLELDGNPGADFTINETLFNQLTTGIGVIPPATFSIASVSPADGATNIAISPDVIVTFSSSLDASSLTYTLQDGGGGNIANTLSYNSDSTVITINPNSNLNNSTNYTLSITEATGKNGASIATTTTYTFTTIDAGSISVTSVVIASKNLTTGDTIGTARDASIVITFSSSIQNTTFVNNTHYTLNSFNFGTFNATTTVSGNQLTITPDVNFSSLEKYTVSLFNSVVIGDNGASLSDFEEYTFITAFFSGGDGSATFPYELTTAVELDSVRNYSSNDFRMENDIDLITYLIDVSGVEEGWEPIDNFTGNFNGAGFEVQNMFIRRPDEDNIGFFGTVTGATIDSLGITINPSTTFVGVLGRQRVGGLIGQLEGGVVRRCYVVTGGQDASVNTTATSASRTGGFVGFIQDGEISESFATVAVNAFTGTADRLGGFVGGIGVDADGITNCYSTGNVIGDVDVGGFLGWISINSAINDYSDYITSCYSTGEVFGDSVTTGIFSNDHLDGETIATSYYDTDAAISGTNFFSSIFTITGLNGVDFSDNGKSSASFPGFDPTIWSFTETGISGTNGPTLEWEE